MIQRLLDHDLKKKRKDQNQNDGEQNLADLIERNNVKVNLFFQKHPDLESMLACWIEGESNLLVCAFWIAFEIITL